MFIDDDDAIGRKVRVRHFDNEYMNHIYKSCFGVLREKFLDDWIRSQQDHMVRSLNKILGAGNRTYRSSGDRKTVQEEENYYVCS